MTATLALNLEQLKALLGQCNTDEKIELIRYLEDDTFLVRFNNLLFQLKTEELTLEEITREVESVRESRYAAK